MRHRALPFLGLVASLAASTISAQSLYSVNPTGPRVIEITGPAVVPSCPNGPIISAFPGMVGPCPPLNTFTFVSGLGDVAVDTTQDLIYVSDGLVINVFTPTGLQVAGVPAPFAVRGMGIDDPGGRLWLTDGISYGAVALFAPGCGLAPGFVAGPWPVPFGGPFFVGPMQDIDWDPSTGSLMGCGLGGMVVSFLPGPAPALGPFGSYPTAAGFCGLPQNLTGLALDKTIPGSGVHYVCDGLRIAYAFPGGAPAAPKFYSPQPCFPEPTGASAGLAFAARQITYGMGADTTGLSAPTIGSVGQSYAGNPAYTMTLSGSVAGGTAILFAANNPFCPPFAGPATFGLPLYLQPPLNMITTVGVGVGGNASFTVAIPAVTPIGSAINLQWWVGTGGSIQCTSGAHLTVSLP